MEQRHRAVGDVVPLEAVRRRRAQGDRGQAALGAPDGLGRAGRPRGEQQEEECSRGRLAHFGESSGGPLPGGSRAGRVGGRCPPGAPGPRDPEVSRRPTRAPSASVMSSCAVRTQDVVGERLAAARGVDADHHGAGQCGAPNQNRNSGTFPRRMPTWNGPGPAHCCKSDARRRFRRPPPASSTAGPRTGGRGGRPRDGRPTGRPRSPRPVVPAPSTGPLHQQALDRRSHSPADVP